MKKAKTYQEEVEHLSLTIDTLEKSIVNLEEDNRLAKKEVIELYSKYSPETPEYYALIPVAINKQKYYEKTSINYTKAIKKPYFGEINFNYEHEKTENIIYIGKIGINSHGCQSDIQIIDWRAPISELYYNANLGPSAYTVDNDIFNVDLNLKKTFEIVDGQMIDIFDSEIIANDDLLIKYLSKNKDIVLKDIVSTIQKDQNDIIRKGCNKNIIVQGVAGSGKTTVALHRIAYLLYNFKESLNWDNVYVVASSELFLNYITSMLPDLDVPEIKQGTIATLLEDCAYDFDPKFSFKIAEKTIDNDSNTINLKDLYPDKLTQSQETNFAIKSIVRYFNKIQRRIFVEELPAFLDFQFLNQETVVSFIKGAKRLSLVEKADVLDELLLENIYGMKYKIIHHIIDNKEDPVIIQECKSTLQTKYEFITEDEVTQKFNGIINKFKGYYKNKIKKIKYTDAFYNVCMDLNINNKMSKGKCGKSLSIWEGCIMLIIMNLIDKIGMAQDVRHIVIDEAQDFDLLIFYSLRKLFSKCNFTLVGDVTQNISSKGLNSWEEMIQFVFKNDIDYLKLNKSYRNTIQISNFATKLMKQYSDFDLYIEPVVRQGNEVGIWNYENEKSKVDMTQKLTKAHQEEKYNMNAIICKDDEQCKNAYKFLHEKIMVNMLTPELETLSAGNYIVSLKNSKGLEFDSVIIWDFDDYNLSNAVHLKSLYVAITRALHNLDIFTNKELF